jgi:hypothetical protein
MELPYKKQHLLNKFMEKTAPNLANPTPSNPQPPRLCQAAHDIRPLLLLQQLPEEVQCLRPMQCRAAGFENVGVTWPQPPQLLGMKRMRHCKALKEITTNLKRWKLPLVQ